MARAVSVACSRSLGQRGSETPVLLGGLLDEARHFFRGSHGVPWSRPEVKIVLLIWGEELVSRIGVRRVFVLNDAWAMPSGSKKGGFYHDGRFPTLLDVVNHYDGHFGLGLTPEEKADLVQYLLSL